MSVLYNEINFVRHEMSHLAKEAFQARVTDVENNNRHKWNVVTGLAVGIILQTAGVNMNQEFLDTADLATTLSADLIRASFLLPRIFQVKPTTFLDFCDITQLKATLYADPEPNTSRFLNEYFIARDKLRIQEFMVTCFPEEADKSAKMTNLNEYLAKLKQKEVEEQQVDHCGATYFS